jgi:hypothetical protein
MSPAPHRSTTIPATDDPPEQASPPPSRGLSRRATGLLLALGMTAGLWVAYEVVGRPQQEPVAPAPRDPVFLPLTVRDPYQPSRVYVSDRVPAAGKLPPARSTFTPDTPTIYCVYDLPRVRPKAEIEASLRFGGRPLTQRRTTALPGSYARGYVAFSPMTESGMPAGIYEIRLRLPGMTEPLTDVSFEVVPPDEGGGARAAQSNISVRNVTVALGVDAQGRPVSPLPKFPRTTRRLVLCFEFLGAEPGQVVTCEWRCEDEVLPQGTAEVAVTADAGRAFAWIETEPRVRLPTGKYEVRVEDEDIVLGKATFEVVP